MQLLEFWAPVLLWVGGGYLAVRLGVVCLHAWRSRRAYAGANTEDTASDPHIEGALIGLAAGDAVGLPAESLPPWLIRLRYPAGPKLRAGILRFVRRPGDISDDTQLSIAVGRSILLDANYSHERFLDELRAWHAYGVGAGRSTQRAAAALWHFKQPQPNRSDGNGVAMRVAPLALSSLSDDAMLKAVELNASATHGGQFATRAAKLWALLVRQAARGLPRGGELDGLVVDAARRAGFPLDRYHRHRQQRELADALRECRTGPYVLESVTAALLILRWHGDDFIAAMRAGFFAGGDVDTVCSLVGAVVGASLGAAAIPPEWCKVSARDQLRQLARRLSHPVPPEARDVRITEESGDIAQVEADVIVNAWNRNAIPAWLLLPQGVSGALKRAGGREAIREISRTPPLPLGGARETGAGKLPARWVIHVAGINLLWRSSPRSVVASVEEALRLAQWLGARTVALPAIGAGSGGMGERRALELVREAAEPFRRQFDEIRIVRYAPRTAR